jgi:hypothetical protein
MTKGKLEQGDYIQLPEKGLSIIKAFGQNDPTLTLSEAASDLTRLFRLPTPESFDALPDEAAGL